MSLLKNYRKKELSFLANEIVDEYDFENEIDVELIAKKFISFYYDNYGVEEDGTEFEGLIIYDGYYFHVHINLDFVGFKDSKRARFSFAHELGHYFIVEHHHLLKNNYNPSNFNPKETNIIELEANYFAGVFLMPEKKFKTLSNGVKFSLDLVTKISDYFNVSRLAVLLRYVEIGAYPLMIAYCKNGILEWFERNEEFPHKAFRTKVGKELPINSTVGEYFRVGDYAKHTDIQRIDVEDWFYYNGKDEVILNEQCFYSEYGYVISLIWPD